jgi:hypothetical protein
MATNRTVQKLLKERHPKLVAAEAAAFQACQEARLNDESTKVRKNRSKDRHLPNPKPSK